MSGSATKAQDPAGWARRIAKRWPSKKAMVAHMKSMAQARRRKEAATAEANGTGPVKKALPMRILLTRLASMRARHAAEEAALLGNLRGHLRLAGYTLTPLTEAAPNGHAPGLFQCPHCPRSFGRPPALGKHMSSAHPVEFKAGKG